MTTLMLSERRTAMSSRTLEKFSDSMISPSMAITKGALAETGNILEDAAKVGDLHGWQKREANLLPFNRASNISRSEIASARRPSSNKEIIMTKFQIIERLLNPGIVAVIRVESSAALLPICEALLDGGVTALEITMTSPDAIGDHRGSKQGICRARADGRGYGAGYGNVPRGDPGRGAVRGDAGVPSRAIVQMAVRYGKPVACGAYTPTEALTAHEAGADFIKLFPADGLGPKYIQNILGPLPMLRIIPTGGVTVETAGDFLKSGLRRARSRVEPDRQGISQEQGLGRADRAREGVRRRRRTRRADRLCRRVGLDL